MRIRTLAREDQGLGDAFAAAQRALCRRVEVFDEERSERLLAVLFDLAALYDSDAGLEEALGTLVWACRRAAFDFTLPREGPRVCAVTTFHSLKGFPGLGQRDLPKVQEVVASLRALDLTFLSDAEGQEEVDANLNAAALREAAGALGRAASLVEEALPRETERQD